MADIPDSGDNTRDNFSPPPLDKVNLTSLGDSVARPSDLLKDSVTNVLGKLDSGFMKPSSWTPDAGLKAEAQNIPSFHTAFKNVTKSA